MVSPMMPKGFCKYICLFLSIAVSALRMISVLSVYSVLTIIYCGIFADPKLQSKLARLNVTKWVQTKFPPPVPDIGTNHVCLTLGGRLGNHMFQYASIFGIARQHHFTIVLTEDDDLVQFFNITSVALAPARYVCDSFEKVLEKNACCVYDKTLMDLPVDRNYVIGDWLQSWKYFRHVFPEVRQQFVFNKDVRQTAEYVVGNLRDKASFQATVVGIHMRIGDILHDEFLRDHGYRTAPDSYVHNAIDYIMQKYEDVIFIVCSDDITQAKKVIGLRDLEIHYFSISPIHDMAILSKCDHVIMTVGTFGWWAGFLSNGTVIYYKYPYAENSPAWKAHNYDDFYLPHWIGLG